MNAQTQNPILDDTHVLDTRDMVVVHNAFRGEFGLAAALVRGVAAGDETRAGVVATHLDLLLSLLHHHHEGEDRLLWPTLLERAPGEVDELVATMEAQHHGIHHIIDAVEVVMPFWQATADAAARGELATLLDELQRALVEHLEAEEHDLLPLAAQKLTDEEWHRLGEEGVGGVPKKLLPLVFGMLMYRGDPEVIAGMLSHAPLLPRLVMPFAAPRSYARYAKRIHGTATP